MVSQSIPSFLPSFLPSFRYSSIQSSNSPTNKTTKLTHQLTNPLTYLALGGLLLAVPECLSLRGELPVGFVSVRCQLRRRPLLLCRRPRNGLEPFPKSVALA